jgi:hypothetical protein
VGANLGKVVKIGGKLPVNFFVGAYYKALRPEYSSRWQLRTQVTFILKPDIEEKSHEAGCSCPEAEAPR